MKTIEEAADDYSKSEDYAGLNSFNRFENIFKAGFKFAQRWISVEEELPEECMPIIDNTYVDEVICKGHYTNATYGYRLIRRVLMSDKWVWSNMCSGFTITHWRPIDLK